MKKLQKDQKGFTIIEVLIVLAIAGLILLIVFLAVPALQRNSRNTQRNSDAAAVVGAIAECTANSNGNLANCDSAAELTNYIDFAQLRQLTTTFAASPGLNQFQFATNTQCNSASTASQAGGGTRSFTLVYELETRNANAGKCVQG